MPGWEGLASRREAAFAKEVTFVPEGADLTFRARDIISATFIANLGEKGDHPLQYLWDMGGGASNGFVVPGSRSRYEFLRWSDRNGRPYRNPGNRGRKADTVHNSA
ncbi:hypothetical protein Psi02_41790 [Planotetraspora silvatica]|uniref:Uncharacterized protein n=1 Tax=Planotetraspora silvatica TaxID=234614 RepID=A0A8J3UNS6_9ACTN|nr:hypothetical protein Psi02_41790 [Planotetraspora silvatica]